jgi:hypothetical protein
MQKRRQKTLPPVQELGDLSPTLIDDALLKPHQPLSPVPSVDDELSVLANRVKEASLDSGAIVEADEERVVTVKLPRSILQYLDEQALRDKVEFGIVISKCLKDTFSMSRREPMHLPPRRGSAYSDVARAIVLVSLLSR